jgi:hypothetical protein
VLVGPRAKEALASERRMQPALTGRNPGELRMVQLEVQGDVFVLLPPKGAGGVDEEAAGAEVGGGVLQDAALERFEGGEFLGAKEAPIRSAAQGAELGARSVDEDAVRGEGRGRLGVHAEGAHGGAGGASAKPLESGMVRVVSVKVA